MTNYPDGQDDLDRAIKAEAAAKRNSKTWWMVAYVTFFPLVSLVLGLLAEFMVTRKTDSGSDEAALLRFFCTIAALGSVAFAVITLGVIGYALQDKAGA